MALLDVPKVPEEAKTTVSLLDNKEQEKACQASQEATAATEISASVAPHPLSDLVGKYGGGYWDELFDKIDQERQNENAVDSQT